MLSGPSVWAMPISGAMLMYQGIPYDSDMGRDTAAAITAVMTGEAYLQSARIASVTGPFPRYSENREPMLEVMEMHREAAFSYRSGPRATGALSRCPRCLGPSDRARTTVRIPQRPDHRARLRRAPSA